MSHSQQIQEHTTSRYVFDISPTTKTTFRPTASFFSPIYILAGSAEPCAPATWHSNLLRIVCGYLGKPRGLGTSSSYLGFIVYTKTECFVLLQNEKRQQRLPSQHRKASIKTSIVA